MLMVLPGRMAAVRGSTGGEGAPVELTGWRQQRGMRLAALEEAAGVVGSEANGTGEDGARLVAVGALAASMERALVGAPPGTRPLGGSPALFYWRAATCEEFEETSRTTTFQGGSVQQGGLRMRYVPTRWHTAHDIVTFARSRTYMASVYMPAWMGEALAPMVEKHIVLIPHLDTCANVASSPATPGVSRRGPRELEVVAPAPNGPLWRKCIGRYDDGVSYGRRWETTPEAGDLSAGARSAVNEAIMVSRVVFLNGALNTLATTEVIHIGASHTKITSLQEMRRRLLDLSRRVREGAWDGVADVGSEALAAAVGLGVWLADGRGEREVVILRDRLMYHPAVREVRGVEGMLDGCLTPLEIARLGGRTGVTAEVQEALVRDRRMAVSSSIVG